MQFFKGDFFKWVIAQNGITCLMLATSSIRSLLDIKHTSDFYLSASHIAFCGPDGLRRFARYLRPKDIFAQWSNQPSDDDFLTRRRSVFADACRVKIPFHNTLEYREFI